MLSNVENVANVQIKRPFFPSADKIWSKDYIVVCFIFCFFFFMMIVLQYYFFPERSKLARWHEWVLIWLCFSLLAFFELCSHRLTISPLHTFSWRHWILWHQFQQNYGMEIKDWTFSRRYPGYSSFLILVKVCQGSDSKPAGDLNLVHSLLFDEANSYEEVGWILRFEFSQSTPSPVFRKAVTYEHRPKHIFHGLSAIEDVTFGLGHHDLGFAQLWNIFDFVVRTQNPKVFSFCWAEVQRSQ